MRLLIVLLALGGCATPLPAEVPRETGRAAVSEYGDCIMEAAPLVDDNVSDAFTIAIAADAACAESSQAITDTYSSTQQNVYSKAIFARELRRQKLGYAASIIAGVRNGTIH